jgi:tripartite-type tricarboxylate transporter receptor subunit TctC
MRKTFEWSWALAIAAAVLPGLMSPGALADEISDYPNRPISIVVGFTPGGGNDVVARIVGARAGEILKTSVVILNKPGANGAIAMEMVAKAAPDGYTIILGSSSVLAINPVLSGNPDQDPTRNFVGLGTLAMTPQVLAVNPAVEAKTLDEFVALSQKKEISVASAGIGGLPHLAIELIQSVEKAKLLHVPYRGGAPAATDVVAGHMQGIVMDLPAVQSFILDGQMRAIAVLNDKRSAALPNVPTSVEQGAKEIVAVNWYGLLAPAKTPEPIADRLFQAFSTAANDPAVVTKLAELGIEPMTSSSRADFNQFLGREMARWSAVAKVAGLTKNQ